MFFVMQEHKGGGGGSTLRCQREKGRERSLYLREVAQRTANLLGGSAEIARVTSVSRVHLLKAG